MDCLVLHRYPFSPTCQDVPSHRSSHRSSYKSTRVTKANLDSEKIIRCYKLSDFVTKSLTTMYHLTESDLREFSGPEGRPAIIRASKSPHARILEALLKLNDPEKSASRFLEAETAGYYTSALHEAIKAKRSANVSLLLAHGADPNGLPLDCFSRCSVGLHRLRNLRWSSASSNFPVSPSKEEALAKILQRPQTVPLTAEEVEARRSMRARCWTEVQFQHPGQASRP